jgi:hypothetical protein
MADEDAPLSPVWNAVALAIATVLEWIVTAVVFVVFVLPAVLVPVVCLYLLIRFVRWAWTN